MPEELLELVGNRSMPLAMHTRSGLQAEDFVKAGEGCYTLYNNDPRHISNLAKDCFNKEGVNWWKTPPESPYKEFIRREVKPNNRNKLTQGILT